MRVQQQQRVQQKSTPKPPESIRISNINAELGKKFAFSNDNASNAFNEQYQTFGEIIEKTFIILGKLFQLLKHLILRLLGGQRTIPWVQMILIGLLILVVLKKEMQFQINFKSPFTVGDNRSALPNENITDDGKSRSESTFSFSKAVNYKENLAAPISPDYLKDAEVNEYVQRFAVIAKSEQDKFGIPASINMAQALIESRAGDSRLAQRNNNHFGMKCFSKKCKKGHCSNFSDDHHKDFFRKYKSAWESWREHSKMISTGRYKPLLDYKNDYRAWAENLSALGYATDKEYTAKLIYIIEKYELYKLDK